MTAAYIAKVLNGRRSGSDWMARCPAHDDVNPSLSLRDISGKVLVHCFAGCSQREVIAALRERGLWPEQARRQWTYSERRAYGRCRKRAEVLAQRALLWRAALVRECERAKTAAHERYLAHPCLAAERAWARTARRLYLAERLRSTTLVRAYREAVRRDPAALEQLISKARKNEAHAGQCVAFVVRALAMKVGNGQ